MKKMYNIFDEKTYPKSKFDKLMEKVTAIVLLVGLIIFLLIIASLIKQNTSIVFYNKINPIAVFMQNHGVNFKVIWSDCSPYIVGWFVWLSFFYRKTWKKQSMIDSGVIARNIHRIINHTTEIDELKAANKILRESNMRLFEKTPAARLRDEKGHFLPKPKK